MKKTAAFALFASALAAAAVNYTSIVDGAFSATTTWDPNTGTPNLTGPDNALITNVVAYAAGGDLTIRGGSTLTLDQSGSWSQTGAGSWFRVADQNGTGTLTINSGVFSNGTSVNLMIGGFAAGANGVVNIGDGVGAASSAVVRAGAQNVALGRDSGSTGTVTVASDGLLETTGLHFGADKDGNGTGGSGMLIQNGGRITVSGATRIGRKAGSFGTVIMNDGVFRSTGSGQEFWVGEYGTGFLLLTNTAQLVLGDANHHAATFSGTGTILVAGSAVVSNEAASGRNFSLGGVGGGAGYGALVISNAGRFIVPRASFQAGAGTGRGYVSVTDDGYLRLNRGWIGKDANSTGLLEVTGNGRVEVSGGSYLVVGENGPGTVRLSGNAMLYGTIGNLAVGAQSGGRGYVLLQDNASITNNSSTSIGNNAGASGTRGAMRLEGNSLVRTLGSTGVGLVSGTTGELTIASAGATYTAGGALNIAAVAGADGSVNVEAGLLQVGAGIGGGVGSAILNLGGATLRATGSGTVAVPVMLTGTNGDATIDTGSFTLSFNRPVAGGAVLYKSGGGKLVFNAVNTFTNQFYIPAGTLGGTGTLAAAVILADGTFLENSSAGVGGTLTLTGALLAAGTTLNARLVDTNTPAFVVNGVDALVTAGSNRVNIAGTLALGTYDVIRFAGTLASPANFVLGDLPSRTLATLNPLPTGSVQLIVTGVDRIKWSGAASAAWDVDTTTNWVTESAAVPTAYLAGDSVLFDDTATGPATVVVATAISPNSVTVSNDLLGYRIAGAAVSSSLLTKRGGGLLELDGTNGFGAVALEAGTLRLLSNSALGSALVTLGGAAGGTNGASLLLRGGRAIGNAVVVSSVLTGPAVVGHDTAGGAGYTELTGAIALQRDVILTSGNNNDRLHFGGTISGAGNVTFAGGSRITASGNNTFVGDVTISGAGTVFQTFGGNPIPDASDVAVGPDAVFQVYTSESIDALTGSGIVQPVAGNPVLTFGAAGGSGTFSGLVRDNGANYVNLVKTGAGTQTLDTVHTFTGQTTVNAGVLRLGVPFGITNGGAVVDGTGTLDLNGNSQALAYLASSGTGGTVTNPGANATLTLRQLFAANRDFFGSIGGDLTVNVTTGNNSAAQSFRGVNTYSGGTIIAGGQLRVAQDAGLGAVPVALDPDNVLLDGGTLQNYDSSPVLAATRGITITANGGRLFVGWSATNVMEIAGPIAGPGSLTKSDGATLLLTGSNTFSGDTILSLTASGFGPGTIRVGNTYALQYSTFDATGIGGNGTLDLNGLDVVLGGLKGAGANIANFSGRLTVGGNDQSTSFGGTLSGSGSLTKTGAGTLTFTATNTYEGPTDISNGTFAVNGALAGTGTVTVAAGATLTGNVAVGGALLVDGTFAVGLDVGAAAVAGDATVGAAGTLAFEVGGAAPGQFDTLTVTGALTLAGTLKVELVNGYAPLAGDLVTLASGATLSGAFAVTNLPPAGPGLAWQVVYTGSQLALLAVAAPVGGYETYVAGVTNGLTGYADDADGDGYANLLEYATGGSPTNADNAARMTGGRTNALLQLKFLRNTNAVDATLLVEGSFTATNGAEWVAIATNTAGSWGGATNVVESVGGSPVNVTVDDTQPAATNRFLRLRVTRP